MSVWSFVYGVGGGGEESADVSGVRQAAEPGGAGGPAGGESGAGGGHLGGDCGADEEVPVLRGGDSGDCTEVQALRGVSGSRGAGGQSVGAGVDGGWRDECVTASGRRRAGF